MQTPKRVLIIGLEPELIDFTDPIFAATPGLSTEKVRAGLESDKARLEALGYAVELCLTDFGETAEAQVQERLERTSFDCVVIGAGVRTVPQHFLLFERLVNLLHTHAPRARICFNTKPDDTAEAVQRWI